MTDSSPRVERVVQNGLPGAAAVIAVCAALVVVLAGTGGAPGSSVEVGVLVATAVVAVLGGVLRAVSSPKRAGLGTAVWSAAAAMSLSSAVGTVPPFPGPAFACLGIAVALALALCVIGAAATRRDRRQDASATHS